MRILFIDAMLFQRGCQDRTQENGKKNEVVARVSNLVKVIVSRFINLTLSTCLVSQNGARKTY
jgi:hypothetical protein